MRSLVLALALSLFAGAVLAAATPSPNDTVVITGSTAAITDAAGNSWTITPTTGAATPGQVAVNGVIDTTTSGVTEIAYVNGLIWQENTSSQWYSKPTPAASWSIAFTTSPLPNATAPAAILTWGAPTTYSNGTAIPSTVTLSYNVYQGTSATALVQVASGLTTLTSTLTAGLVAGQTYYWAITAVAGGLEGAQSNVASKVFPPPTPVYYPPGTVTLTVR